MKPTIAILTSKTSWFQPYAKKLVKILKERDWKVQLFFRHEDIDDNFNLVFILSYFRIIEKKFLEKHANNLVIHESNLPQGRGWAPLFWQILEGKNKIPIVLFEARKETDTGEIYLKDVIELKGHELHDEIRKNQALKTIELCLLFIQKYKQITPKKQKGIPSYYPKRTPKDSELNINKNIKEQINLLRIANNEGFPAFFKYHGYKYILKIFKENVKKS